MHTRRYILLAIIIVATAICGVSQNYVKVGSAAPAFSGTTFDGADFDLANTQGKVVVMTFWSTRCEICRVELPKLDAIVRQYDPGKVVFLALTMENEEKIAPFLKRNPFQFRVMPNSFGVLLQYADRNKAGVVNMGFPSFFVIDQAGRVQYRSSGYDKTNDLNAAIGRLVSER